MSSTQPLISIIIPAYNTVDTIDRCIESCLNQGVDHDKYEIIIVNDASTDNTLKYLEEHYGNNNFSLDFLRIISNPTNLHLGGARNTGINHAKGKFIYFLDADDLMAQGALSRLIEEVGRTPDIDFLMYDYQVSCNGDIIKPTVYHDVIPETQIISGEEFLCLYPVAWEAWCYLYRTEKLIKGKYRFIEHKRFEDADFVLRYIAESSFGRYADFVALDHTTNERASIVVIGNNAAKIREAFELKQRIAALTLNPQYSDKVKSKLMAHASFGRRSYILRLIWRIPYTEAASIMKDTAFDTPSGDRLVDFSASHSHVTAFIATLLRPVLNMVWRLKRKF